MAELSALAQRLRILVGESAIVGTGVDGALDAYMNEMHDAGKLLLARLINDDMCEKIGVDRPE